MYVTWNRLTDVLLALRVKLSLVEVLYSNSSESQVELCYYNMFHLSHHFICYYVVNLSKFVSK